MAQSFVIDQVSWHTSMPGNVEPRARIVYRFFCVARFLQDNALARRELAQSPEEVGDDFAIHSDDLTDEGLAVMRAAYQKWLQRLNKGKDPADVSLLARALAQVRGR